MKHLDFWYSRFVAVMSSLRSPLLLVIRLYWGWQLAMTGWGKMHNMAKITDFFMSLGIPFPAFNAHAIAGLEFFGGLLLIVGLGSRVVSLLMVGNMLVAYWTADREAFLSVFSDPDKFAAAAPFTILFASVLILVFGAGFLSLDYLLARRFQKEQLV
jgi:putative oxidoreductase